VADWLQGLPDFRQSLSSHLESVDHMTELAIVECQRYIQSLQKQRQAREEEACQYLDVVMRQGQQLLTRAEAEEILEDLEDDSSLDYEDYSSLDYEDYSSWEDEEVQLLLQQQQQDPQQQQLEQQRQQGFMSLADMPGHATYVLPAESDPAYEQQLQQQPPQQWDVVMSDAPAHRQGDISAAEAGHYPSEGAVQGADAVRGDLGPPPAGAPLAGLAPLVSVGSNKQLPEIQQQQQQPDTAAGIGSPAAALPFPGGPTLGAWGLGQWIGMGSAPTQSLTPAYSGPDAYVRTPVLVSKIMLLCPTACRADSSTGFLGCVQQYLRCSSHQFPPGTVNALHGMQLSLRSPAVGQAVPMHSKAMTPLLRCNILARVHF
jgi:hypothetical protein